MDGQPVIMKIKHFDYKYLLKPSDPKGVENYFEINKHRLKKMYMPSVYLGNCLEKYPFLEIDKTLNYPWTTIYYED